MSFDKQARYENILSTVEDYVQQSRNRHETLQKISQLLHDQIDYFQWVGFYLVDPDKERELVLGPFVGDPTDHTRIPFGTGICGQAADREETFVVQDVSKEDNYLSCSIYVQSEIVVPVVKNGKVIGELDIDSHDLGPFSEIDRQYLEKVCQSISKLF